MLMYVVDKRQGVPLEPLSLPTERGQESEPNPRLRSALKYHERK